MKVTQKRINVLHLSKQTEYNYDVVKKLVGQGLLYIRIKVGFEFVVNENHASNSDSELLQVGAQETSTIPATLMELLAWSLAPPMELPALSLAPPMELLVLSLTPLMAILVLSLATLMAVLALFPMSLMEPQHLQWNFWYFPQHL